MILSDLESLERRLPGLKKRATNKDKEALLNLPIMEKTLTVLQEGKPARIALEGLNIDEQNILHKLNLITSKPVLYVCNVKEEDASKGNEWTKKIAQMAAEQNCQSIIISAAIEAEISQLGDEEAKEYLEMMNLSEPGLNRLIKEGYSLLNLITYFTCGPKETRAWTIEKGTKAPQAAGVIHSDFERGFIRAQTIAYEDYLAYNGENGAKEAGKARDEGKEYIVQDGDVIVFKHNT